MMMGLVRTLSVGAITISCAACANPYAPDAAYAACPVVTAPIDPDCVPHRLPNLSGNWTLTGFSSSDDCWGEHQEVNTQQPVGFQLDGCSFEGSGQLDDTVAIESTIISSNDRSSVDVCVHADGRLYYDSGQTAPCPPGSQYPVSVTSNTGTLSR